MLVTQKWLLHKATQICICLSTCVFSCPVGKPRHRAWDSGARQLTNRQATNQKPAKQRTNRPTSQQSNKLKTHQTTRAPDQKLTKKSIKHRTKINQKSNKNEPNINQKATKIGLLGALGASCAALGGVLGASWLQEPTSHQKAGSLDPPGPPKLDPKSTKN